MEALFYRHSGRAIRSLAHSLTPPYFADLVTDASLHATSTITGSQSAAAACLRFSRSYTTARTRDPRYAQLQESDLTAFRDILGPSSVLTDPTALQAVNTDWMNLFEGKSQVVLRPKTTQEVSQVLAHCNLRRLAVVPQGGNTGLCGGSVPLFDEVVLSTAALNGIHSFDPVSGIVTCGAGCVLEVLDKHVGEQGFAVPLDLGAKGSCQIGGNVSTNAGGLRLLRYGSLRGSVLGIEAVLPDGTELDLLRALRKDNTGYDLKQLFIGGEGSLGVVTAVAMLCAPKWSSVNVAYLAVADWEATQKVFMSARKHLGEILSAFEFLDQAALQMTLRNLPAIQNPLPESDAPFFLVIETSGSNSEHDNAKLDAFLEDTMGTGIVVDGTIAQGSSQAAAIWSLRESISDGLRQAGPVYKYDLSVPVADMYGLVEVMRSRLAGFPDVQVVGYGHLGDGNLHLNVSAPSGRTSELSALIEPFVYEWTRERRGSISAEHGLGQMKADYMGYSKPQEAIELMRKLKTLVDPNEIMNPYKFLPQTD